MLALDGTENKARLGANAILGTSLAVAKAAKSISSAPAARNDRSNFHGLPMPAKASCGPLGGGALTRAIGADQLLEVDWRSLACGPGEQLLLCSDGVNKEMSDEELAVILLASASAQAALDAIVDTCLARGGRDNVSAIVLRMPG